MILRYVEDSSIDPHPKMTRRQNARLTMVFLCKPLVSECILSNVYSGPEMGLAAVVKPFDLSGLSNAIAIVLG